MGVSDRSYAMKNSDEELTPAERAIVDRAKKRYRGYFYRHGYLVIWLVVPMTSALFVPSLRPYQDGLSVGVFVVLLLSYSSISTRIIGKLAANESGRMQG